MTRVRELILSRVGPKTPSTLRWTDGTPPYANPDDNWTRRKRLQWQSRLYLDVALFNKESEREHLEYFLAARTSATGEKLTLVADSEAPDFVCSRPDGALVGIEHTRLEYNPERTEILEACRAYSGELDNFAVFWAAARALASKARKRRKPHWKHPDATILVLDLPEGYRFEDWPADSGMAEDFSDSGFIEVWISDHSSIEEFAEITAIGLYPQSIWGIQGQGYLWGVPYK